MPRPPLLMAPLFANIDLAFLITALVKIVGFTFMVILPLVTVCVYFERRFSAIIQDRVGPNRVGIPLTLLGFKSDLQILGIGGLFQAAADGVKFILKEDFTPKFVNTFYYWLAPCLTVVPALLTCAVLPFGSELAIADLNGLITALGLPALPSIPVQAVIADLNLGGPVIDPTTLSGEELVKEVQRVVKALLGYGARMPKELMLYVKNMVFLDGAIAKLAPDLDLLAEVANISMLFAQRHGERLGRELGIDHTSVEINLDSVKASLGVDASTNSMTYRDLQKRRQLIQKRMREHVGK